MPARYGGAVVSKAILIMGFETRMDNQIKKSENKMIFANSERIIKSQTRISSIQIRVRAVLTFKCIYPYIFYPKNPIKSG